MIDALVFSKDRAAQLDLLLRSITKHAADVYRSIVVLYTSSNSDHERGYRILEREHENTVSMFMRESHFEADVRIWLEAAGEHVSFLVDDDVFYRTAPAPLWLPWSYRGADFDYPFSVDGNVYHRGSVMRLLEGLPFTCPTELEWFAHDRRGRLPFESIRRPPYACLVNVPANRVATVGGTAHYDSLMLEPGQLLERYFDGARLELAVEPPPGVAHLPVDGPLPYKWIRTYAPGLIGR